MESSTTTLGFVVQVDDGRFLRDRSECGWGPRYSKEPLEHATMFSSEQEAQKECSEWLRLGGKIVRVRQHVERATYVVSESSKALLKAVHEVNAAYGKAPPPSPKRTVEPRRPRAQRNDETADNRTENEKYYNCKRALGQSGCGCWLCKSSERRHEDERKARRQEWENSQGPEYWRQRIKEAEERRHRDYVDRLNNGDHDSDRWP